MTTPRRIKTTITVPISLWAAVYAQALVEGTDRNHVVIKALTAYLRMTR
jgi:hypothetical protein